MSYPLTEIGKNIRRVRELKNLTQTFVAEELGISQQAYSKIELGETDVSVGKLQRISEILEVEFDDLVHLENKIFFNISNSPHATNNGVNQHAALTTSERETFQSYIEHLKEEIKHLREDVAFFRQNMAANSEDHSG